MLTKLVTNENMMISLGVFDDDLGTCDNCKFKFNRLHFIFFNACNIDPDNSVALCNKCLDALVFNLMKYQNILDHLKDISLNEENKNLLIAAPIDSYKMPKLTNNVLKFKKDE